MREIKFRAWDKEEKKMIYPQDRDKGFHPADLHSKLMYRPLSALLGDANDYVWMQFTTLLDKNGKEIYESDYVKCEGLVCEVQYVVEPAIAGFVFNDNGRYIEYAVKDGVATHYEVVGNKYENNPIVANNLHGEMPRGEGK